MIAPRAVRAIARNWQDAIDQGLETGEAPLLDGGVMPAPLDGAGQPLALAVLAESRRDAVQPLLAVGGLTAWWLVLLLRRPAAIRPAPTSDPRLVFTATDPATHQAALTTWDRRQSPYRERPGGLPIALQPSFSPDDRPGSAAALESLPFALAADAQARRDGWVAWTAVVVVLVLILLAIIV